MIGGSSEITLSEITNDTNGAVNTLHQQIGFKWLELPSDMDTGRIYEKCKSSQSLIQLLLPVLKSIALLLLHCSRRRRELFAADETTLLHHVNKACEILWQVLACLAGRVKRCCGGKQLNITVGYETGPSSRSTYFGCGRVTNHD